MKSHQGKNKRATLPAQPAITPPGSMGTGKHGRQTGRLTAKTGLARLREVLELSTDVDRERVCDEAAETIERLQAGASRS